MNKCYRLGLVLFAFLTIGAPPVFAQTSSANVPTKSSPSVTIVATVNFGNPSIVSQKGNTIVVGFDISNRVGVQPQVVYAVALWQIVGKDEILVDRKVYSQDILNLGEGEVVHKEVTYVAPAFLSGTYKIGLESRNTDGLPLSFLTIPKPITLTTSVHGHIAVDPAKCYLTVQGESPSTKYSLVQGVDVGSDETLIAHCGVTNDFSTSQQLTPVFETHFRTSFGKVVGTDKASTFTLAAGKTLQFETPIPKVSVPQAYDTVLTFTNSAGDLVSIPVTFHYVSRGASATIQNLTLDKDYYAYGDTANLTFYWSGAADSFDGARGRATNPLIGSAIFSIHDGSGAGCARDYTVNLASSGSARVQHVAVPITADCKNPTAAVKILDTSGNVLAENAYALESSASTTASHGNANIKWALGVLVLILLLGGLILLRKRKGMLPTLILFILVTLTATLLGGQAAKADTFTAIIYGTHTYTGTFTPSLSPASPYTPGQTVSASATVTIEKAECANGVKGDWPMLVSVAASVLPDQSDRKMLIPQTYLYPHMFDGGTNPTSLTTRENTLPYTAPTVPGYYDAIFSLYFNDSDYYLQYADPQREAPPAPADPTQDAQADIGYELDVPIPYQVIGPDLTADSVSVSPSPVAAGTLLTFSGTIHNIGNASTGVGFNTHWQSATDNQGSGLKELPNKSLSALGPSGSAVSTVFNAFASPGLYFIRVCADWPVGTTGLTYNGPGAVVESNENNNCSPWTAVSVGNAPIPGACSNTTNGKAYPYPATEYYPDTQCQPGQGTPSSTTFPAVGASASWTCSGQNGGPPSGTCSASHVTAADIKAVGITNPSTATGGVPVKLNQLYQNIGGTSTQKPWPVLFEISPDSSPAHNPRTRVYAIAPTYAAGQAGLVYGSYTFPSPGTFYIRSCGNASFLLPPLTDPDGSSPLVSPVFESKYDNNCSIWFHITISSTLDLTATNTAVTPASPTPGVAANLSALVSNGNGSTMSTVKTFPTSFQIDPLREPPPPDEEVPNTILADGGWLYPTTTPVLIAGASKTVYQSFTFPSPGTYHVRACANQYLNFHALTEKDYTNNCSNWLTVTVGTGSGSCATAHYNCTSPTASTNNRISGNQWLWTCPAVPASGGTDASCAETIPPPNVVLTANGQRPTVTVAKGSTPRLRWLSTGQLNATNPCIGTGFNTGGAANNGTTGVLASAPVNTTTVYSIACTGPGGTAHDSVTVNVTDPADVNIHADDLQVAKNSTTNIRWDGTDLTPGNTCTVTERNSTGVISSWTRSVTIQNGGTTFDPSNKTSDPISQPTTFTITCSAADNNASASVTVKPAGTFQEF